MFEIADLKSKKLPELQEIAKQIGVKRVTGLKKMDLIYQIIDQAASQPTAIPKAQTADKQATANAEQSTLNAKPEASKKKRNRIGDSSSQESKGTDVATQKGEKIKKPHAEHSGKEGGNPRKHEGQHQGHKKHKNKQ